MQSILWAYPIRFTNSKVSDLLENHVHYFSILSIKDTWLFYGIESAAISKGNTSHSAFETAYITSIQKEESPAFTIVSKVDEFIVTYLEPFSNHIFLSRLFFK